MPADTAPETPTVPPEQTGFNPSDFRTPLPYEKSSPPEQTGFNPSDFRTPLPYEKSSPPETPVAPKPEISPPIAPEAVAETEIAPDSAGPGRIRQAADRALDYSRRQNANLVGGPARPSDEAIAEVFSKPPGSVELIGETAVSPVLAPEASETEASSEANTGQNERDLYRTIVEARDAHGKNEHSRFVKHLAELTYHISTIANQRNLDKQQHIEFAESILGQIYATERAAEAAVATQETKVQPIEPQANQAPKVGETIPAIPRERDDIVDDMGTEEVEEVDAEKMDAALAAAWAAMEAGHASFDEAKAELKKAIETWNGQTSEAGGDGTTPPVGAEMGKAGGEAGRPEKRSRLKKHSKKVIGALLLVAAGAAGYYLHKYTGHNPSGNIPGTGVEGNIPGTGVEGNIPGTGGVERAPGAIDHTESLSYYGDTIWAHGKASLTQAMGGHTPKNWQIMEWSRQTMNLPANRGHLLQHGKDIWDGARHLPVGWKFTVNENITRLIAQRGA